jgi:hypothetical protein
MAVGEPTWDESGRRSSPDQVVPWRCSSSRGDQWREAIPVVTDGDLGGVEVRGTQAMLLEVAVDREMAGGGVPMVRFSQRRKKPGATRR